MKNNHAQHTALDVETQHCDMLQAQMAEALIEQEAAVAQLAQLDQYDGETRAQLSQSGARHDAARLAHQQTFLARLQQAIMLQHDAVEQAQRRIDALRAQLVTVNQRIAALQALIARNLERERRAIARREQKQSDDLASTRHVRRSDDTPTR